jgi:uracil-DNA glycosylase
MSGHLLARALVDTLPVSAQGLFNPWRQRCQFDSPTNTPEARLERLAQHLDCDAKLILVGEAPGYQGCRYSGIGFTSERLLLDGAIPRIPSLTNRLTVRKLPFSEPSATIVWKTLYRFGIAEETILWNALQMHPFQDDDPWSNRTPSGAEIAIGASALRMLCKSFPSARVIAVGRKAEKALAEIKVPHFAVVRHPARGGATDFSNGLSQALSPKLI